MPKQSKAAAEPWPYPFDAVQVRQDDGSWVYLTRPDSNDAVEPAQTPDADAS